MKSIKRTIFVFGAFVVVFVLAGPAPGTTTTWTGAVGADWFNASNWSQGVPADGDDVVIGSGSVLLTGSTAGLRSFTMNGGTLTCSNWTAKLTATDVVINGGTITLPSAFTNNVMSNRVWIACVNLLVASAGRINVDGKGYKGGDTLRSGNGPGRGGGGGNYNGGGAYGGYGGSSIAYNALLGGMPYGSTIAPLSPGSGGGGGIYGAAGNGGGAILIEATGTVTVEGRITAKGGSPAANHSGGGSGGAIYIACRAFHGAGGVLDAGGGDGWQLGGDGGGGRISVIYDSAAQSLYPAPSVRFSVLPGSAGYSYFYGDIGTIYFPDNSLLPETITGINGQLWGISFWSPDMLAISNCWVRFPEVGLDLNVRGDLNVIGASARLQLGGTEIKSLYRPAFFGAASGLSLNVGGDFILTNNASFYVYSGATNEFTAQYGALISVTGNVYVASGSHIYPCSDPTNGGSAFFYMKNLTVAANGSFNAAAKGWAWGDALYGTGRGWGPGGGANHYRGGSYGGEGGYGGRTYGSSNAPALPGSGGGGSGYGPGGYGGGLVWVEARETITVNGAVTARGGDFVGNHASGGSGGGIYLTCRTFAGNGPLAANGGNGWSGAGQASGGGGGRIAVWRAFDTFTGTASVAGGTSTTINYPGDPGTLVWGQLPLSGPKIYLW